MIENVMRIVGCQVYRLARKIRKQPGHLIRLNHPLHPSLWDRQKGVRGWVGSDLPVTSVTVSDGRGRTVPTEFEARPDVDHHLRYTFSHKTGFLCKDIIDGFLDGAPSVNLRVEAVFSDGTKGAFEIELIDDADARRAKYERFRPLLRCPETQAVLEDRDGALVAEGGRTYPVVNNVVDFLAEDFKKEFSIDHTENISSWDYDERIIDIITESPDKLFLDCGAGLRKECYPNVINYEIVNYSSTDVLGVAEKLPFADNSLDGVISVAVLEHVKDPFKSADEMSRVLKPGGIIFCAVPFLQPLHGYPHHYYNMTAEGMKNLFPGLEIEDVYVPLSLHPIQSIRWMLFSYIQGLPENQRKRFEKLTVKEIFELPQFESFYKKEIPFIHQLSKDAMSEVAAGHCLIARKK